MFLLYIIANNRPINMFQSLFICKGRVRIRQEIMTTQFIFNKNLQFNHIGPSRSTLSKCTILYYIHSCRWNLCLTFDLRSLWEMWSSRYTTSSSASTIVHNPVHIMLMCVVYMNVYKCSRETTGENIFIYWENSNNTQTTLQVVRS